MVEKGISIITILLFSFFVMGQRLSIYFDGAKELHSAYNTVFDDGNFQVLYAGPFSNIDENETTTFGQIRLANIHGVKPVNTLGFKVGGGLQYSFRNYFQIDLGAGFSANSNKIFYSFQNLLINTNEEIKAGNDTELLGNNIRIDNRRALLLTKVKFFPPIKSVIKPYISVGHQFQYVFSSSYYIYNFQEKLNSSEQYYGGATAAEIDNYIVFQNKLFNELKNDQFNNFVSFGFGVQYYRVQAGLDFLLAFPGKNVYLISFRQIALSVKVQLSTFNLMQ